jgi:diguanylate cyclase (GGDEF)-like protein
MFDYKKQILIPLLVVALILSAAMATLFFSAYRLIELGRVGDKVENARYQIIALQKSLVEAETSRRGYLLTYSLVFASSYDQSIQDFAQTYDQLLTHLKDFPELQTELTQVKALTGASYEQMKFVSQIQQTDGSYSPHLSSLRKDTSIMGQINVHLKNADILLLNKKTSIDQEISHSLKATILGSILLVVLIVVVLVIGYRKTINLFEITVKSKSMAEAMSHDAHYDVLTDLPNRRQFETYLNRLISLARRNKESFAIFYMDLDGFKSINDQYGHDAGDEALVFAANRFLDALRQSDFVARLGGDEFAAIIHRYRNRSELTGLSNRVIRYINKEFEVQGHKSQIGVSIGIACYPADADDADSLIRMADLAMYEAKRAGKNRAEFAVVPEGNLVEY